MSFDRRENSQRFLLKQRILSATSSCLELSNSSILPPPYPSSQMRHRQITTEDLEKRARELGVMSIETSAKAGYNVKNLFQKIAVALPGGDAGAAKAESTSECQDILYPLL